MKFEYMMETEKILPYYQFPKFLLELPLSQNAKILYMLLYDRARISQKNHWLNEDGYVYFVFPITEISLKWGKCCTSVKAAMKELDEYGLLIRSSGGFSKPNHLYMRIPCIELISEPDVKQTDENKTSIGMKSCPSFSRKTASSMVGIVPPSKVKEKYNNNPELAIIDENQQVHMARIDMHYGFSVNGVAALHTEILKNSELKPFYDIYPNKFNNKTNGITQRRFLLHGNPLLADWITEQIGDEWITDLPHLAKLKVYVDDPKFQQEFMNIKYQNKLRLAKYIKEHNGIDVDPRSIFDVQVKRLHEYKRQLLNILHVMYLYNQLKDNPNMDMVPRTFIFGAKAAAGYQIAKKTIKLINSVADVINNDKSINGKLKVVFIEDYRVSNAELIFAAADVSEQISTASKEASGTGNMKFMLNGALTLGTMDGANVEIVEEVGKENAFIFGLSADEVINYENNGGYNPEEIFNTDQDIRRVLMQLINGYYSPQDPELFRDIYNSLLNTKNSAKADTYFILKDFRSYAEAQKRVEAAYRDENWWARAAMLNTASAGKFSSDRTIEEYVRDIWHLEKIHVDDDDVKAL